MREFNLNPKKDDQNSSEPYLKKVSEYLKPKFIPLSKPKPGEWRFSFSEQEESFIDYYYFSLKHHQDIFGKDLKIDILPVELSTAEISEQDWDLLNRTADFISRFY